MQSRLFKVVVIFVAIASISWVLHDHTQGSTSDDDVSKLNLRIAELESRVNQLEARELPPLVTYSAVSGPSRDELLLSNSDKSFELDCNIKPQSANEFSGIIQATLTCIRWRNQ